MSLLEVCIAVSFFMGYLLASFVGLLGYIIDAYTRRKKEVKLMLNLDYKSLRIYLLSKVKKPVVSVWSKCTK